MSEQQQRSVDQELMERAHAERRILLTEDKDFGWLTFVAHLISPGVILIRFRPTARRALPDSIIRFVEEFGAQLDGSVVVVEPASVRFSPPPLKR